MKFKRKVAALLASVMVITSGSVAVFAAQSPSAGNYDSSSAGDYKEDVELIEEKVAEGVYYYATGTDSKTPWIEVSGADQTKNLDALISKGLEYKSSKNPNKATGVDVYAEKITPLKISKANMATLAARDGSMYVSGKDGHLYTNVNNGKEFDFSIAIKKDDVVTKKLEAVEFDGELCQFTIGGIGKLPGIMGVYYDEGDSSDYRSQAGLLYYYNSATDKFEYVSHATVLKSGKAISAYGIEKCGKYVITTKELAASIVEKAPVEVDVPRNAKTDADVTKSVVEQINSDDVKKGDIVKINYLPSDLKLEKKVFEAAKEKGVTIKLDSYNGLATFLFKDFGTVSEMSGAFDSTVTIGTSLISDIDKVMAAGVNKNVSYLTVSFKYDGKLPGKTDVTLDVSEGGFKNGDTVYLYYFNESTKAFELVDDAKYVDGFATFEMTHCSDYIVTSEKLQDAAKASAPRTGDLNPVVPFAVVLVAGLGVIAVAFARKKRV